MMRAPWAWPGIELVDGRAGNLFKVIVTRPAVLPAAAGR